MQSVNNRLRLLIVDDDPQLLLLLEEFLSQNYNVDTAISGPEALHQLAEQRYDLVISDINMRPMTGIDLLVEAQRRWPEMKVALITGYDVDDYIRLIKRHRITNVITKTSPFDHAEFINTVKNILEPGIYVGSPPRILKVLPPEYVVEGESKRYDFSQEILDRYLPGAIELPR